jgi:hypothetical protein
VDSHDGDNMPVYVNVDETMAMQGPEDSGEAEAMPTQGAEASGKNEDLIPSIGLLDRESYVDMRAPWVEGAKGEKVRLSGMEFGSSLIVGLVRSFAFK